jgi:DNA-directed RNA polymerase subunit RPC12/RpoP
MTLEKDLKSFLDAYEKLWVSTDYETCDELNELLSIDAHSIEKIIKQISDSDRCANCGRLLDNPDDYIEGIEYESDPSPAQYSYNKGYICPECGNREMF